MTILKRINFYMNSDRIGPDIPTSHWRLHSKRMGRRLCEQKFGHFGINSEFRPGSYAEACSNIYIGDRVVVRPGSFIYADPSLKGGSIRIESDVLLGNCVHMYSTSHNFSDSSLPISEQGYSDAASRDNSIVIGAGSWVGSGVIILRGVKIGKNCVIAAGSVVNKSMPEHSLVAGVPARVLRNLQESQES